MTLQQLRYADAIASCGSFSEASRRVFVSQPTLTESVHALELRTALFARTSRGVTVTREGEVMPAIDRKRNIRVRDRATMTNLILGLDGYTVASGALPKEMNGSDVVAVPLVYDDEIRVGLISRKGVPLSRPGAAFAAAIRERVGVWQKRKGVAG